MKKRQILVGVLGLGLFLVLVMAWTARLGIHAAAQGNGPESQGVLSAQDTPQHHPDSSSQSHLEDDGVSSAPLVQLTHPLYISEFTFKAPSPVPLTCLASDPSTGYVYAQQNNGTGFYYYDPVADAWTSLTSAPLHSGNNGGATYLDGKIYTSYTQVDQIGVYDIAANSWTTIPNGLGVGTGVIATDRQYLYLALGSTFKRYDPGADVWTDLLTPTITIEAWGGMDYWSGNLYVHSGNGRVDFARYNIASKSWATLSSLPDGAVLGSAVDPAGPAYYAYGNYSDDNWYAFDLLGGTWSTTTIPFTVSDGGMAHVGQRGVSGVYFVQGEAGTSFARMETAPFKATFMTPSPEALTCVTTHPSSGYIYAQQDRGIGFYSYDPVADAWTTLASAPLNSGNNGGATYLDGEIYTSYTEVDQIGVYDIATDSWTTIPNGLGLGTGVIASDEQYLYLARGTTFKRYDPGADVWADLFTPTINIQAWGGMEYWDGALYAHRGNGYVEFARYDIASDWWTTLSSLPGGAVLGSAIDPAGPAYYAYGNYGGINWYVFDLQNETWSTRAIPFTVYDGGMAFVGHPGARGIYFVEGETGNDLVHMETSLDAGDVIQSWPTGLTYAWGLGYNTDAADMWLGDVAAGGGTDLAYRFLTTGANTSDTIDLSWSGSFAADMTYNPHTGMLWQVDVAGDDCIHELDPVNKIHTGATICPAWTTSQRGLAYDPSTDTYFAGNWNDGMLYHFAPDGSILQQVFTGLEIAGLAYNPDTQHLFVIVNDTRNPLYVLDVANGFANLGEFTVGGMSAYGGAGLEMDCDGNLWAVDQQTQIVYQFESGETTSLCQDATPPAGSFTINNGDAYANSISVTLNIAVNDPEAGVSDMRFKNDAPWSALVLQDADPWGVDALQQVLTTNNIPYDQLPSSAIAAANLSPYSMVMIPSAQPQGLYDVYNANRPKFEAYVSAGGLIEFHTATWGQNRGSPDGIALPGGVNVVTSFKDHNYVEEPTHPLLVDVAGPIWNRSANHGYFTGVTSSTLTICTEGDTPGGNPTLIEYPLGSGHVIVSAQTLEIAWALDWPGGAILDELIPYIAGHKPWATETPWTLSSSDGVKTVYGEFRNPDGAWSLVYSDTITLDTVLPTAWANCTPETDETSFTVSWAGSDDVSGVASYDLQYRVDTGGTWTAWQTSTTIISDTFGPASPVTVEKDQTYYFRARAHDLAGNQGLYAPGDGDCSTFVGGAGLIYLPLVTREYDDYHAAPCGPDNNYCEDYDGWQIAYGPLRFDTEYRAYPEDGSDYYYFELSSAWNVTIEVQNYQATTGDLILYRHRTHDEPEFVANWGVGGTTMTIVESLQADKYYARVHTTAGFDATTLYTLVVTTD